MLAAVAAMPASGAGRSQRGTTTALWDHTSRSEFLRRAVIARLREVGVPLESG